MSERVDGTYGVQPAWAWDSPCPGFGDGGSNDSKRLNWQESSFTAVLLCPTTEAEPIGSVSEQYQGYGVFSTLSLGSHPGQCAWPKWGANWGYGRAEKHCNVATYTCFGFVHSADGAESDISIVQDLTDIWCGRCLRYHWGHTRSCVLAEMLIVA